MENRINRSFAEMEAFRDTYRASLVILKRVAPFLPKEWSNLRKNLVSVTLEIPRMIAAAAEERTFSSALSKMGDAMVLISICRDVHDRWISPKLCQELLEVYQKARLELKEAGDDPSEK